MVPDSRGSAGLLVLLGASVLLLISVWIAFAGRDPAIDEKVQSILDSREIDPSGSGALALLDEADALSKRLSERKGAVAVPAELRLHRPADEAPPPAKPDPPAIASLQAKLEGGMIVLSWVPSGGPARGYLVERIGKDGGVVGTPLTVPPSVNEHRDGPLDAIVGTRTYRVKAIALDGSVAEWVKKRVPFQARFEIDYLGSETEGRGSFRLAWTREGHTTLIEEFLVDPEAEIGGPVPAKNGLPALDWSTGWHFSGARLSRAAVPRDVQVPRFAPDGRIARDPDTGEPDYELRTVPVTVVTEGAVVIPSDAPGEERWLPKAKE